MAESRLLRSVLFTPGMRGDRIRKALERGEADVVVADLEDAVAPADKAEARRVVVDAVSDCKRESQFWIRVNTWTPGLARVDLEAVMEARPDAVVVPKAASLSEIELFDLLLTRLERRWGVEPGSTGLVPIVETAKGVMAAAELARARRVLALALGAEDLAADAGLRRSRENAEVAYPRAHVALAAAARGIASIDQVFVDLDDVEALGREAREARALGYRGKMVLHPNQLDPVHAAFSPSEEELERARSVVAAAEGEGAVDGGVLRFEGKMIDVPLIEQARRVLVEAEAIRRRKR